MSLTRLIYNSAFLSGWAALIGWLVAEILFFARPGNEGWAQAAMVGAIVGAAIGAGVNMVAGMANGQWKQIVLRSIPGLIGGGLGGLVGTLIGNLLFLVGLPRMLGWMLMGLGIGVIDGLYERSPSKIRNGLIGGGLGGLLGGLLFDRLPTIVASQSGMSGRALGFVILGLCIGALIGTAQVVLKDAWLTVLDGYRAGRQLILSQPVTLLGRGDHLPLPFLGPMNKDIEQEHVRIYRQANGLFVVEDNRSRLGTRLNNQPLQGATVLKDGDVIKFGTNFVRFNERHRRAGETAVVVASPVASVASAPPPKVRRPAAAPTLPAIGVPGSPPAAPSAPSVPSNPSVPPAQGTTPGLGVPPAAISPARPASTAPPQSPVPRPAGSGLAPPPPPRRKP